jgi:hypothetical protein
MKKETVVQIYWVDQGYYTGPINAKDKARELMRGVTTGLYLERDAESITVASERFVSEDGSISYRHIMTFPITCVTKIVRLK